MKKYLFLGVFAISGMFSGCAELQYAGQRALDTYQYDSSTGTHSFECPICNGSGKAVDGTRCYYCKGTGTTRIK